jgi:hypothetical protein
VEFIFHGPPIRKAERMVSKHLSLKLLGLPRFMHGHCRELVSDRLKFLGKHCINLHLLNNDQGVVLISRVRNGSFTRLNVSRTRKPHIK